MTRLLFHADIGGHLESRGPQLPLNLAPHIRKGVRFLHGLGSLFSHAGNSSGGAGCAPLAPQSRPPESNPKRLIEKADRLAWLYNWYLAGPIYAEAEIQFERAGDSRNALYAKIGRLRSEWESMSFPEVSEYLATALESPLVQNDPQLRLWILDAKGTVDLEVNVASARQVYEEAREVAGKLGDRAREARASGELGIIAFLDGGTGDAMNC